MSASKQRFCVWPSPSEVAKEPITLAEKLHHPHTLVYSICHARGFMDIFRRSTENVQAYAGLVVSMCVELQQHRVQNGRRLSGRSVTHYHTTPITPAGL